MKQVFVIMSLLYAILFVMSLSAAEMTEPVPVAQEGSVELVDTNAPAHPPANFPELALSDPESEDGLEPSSTAQTENVNTNQMSEEERRIRARIEEIGKELNVLAVERRRLEAIDQKYLTEIIDLRTQADEIKATLENFGGGDEERSQLEEQLTHLENQITQKEVQSQDVVQKLIKILEKEITLREELRRLYEQLDRLLGRNRLSNTAAAMIE